MYQITINKANNHLSNLLMGLKSIAKPYFNIFAISETSGNSKNNSKNRNNGK